MKSILIVEDDITYGMMLKTWLGKKGFQVASVSSIARAQKHLETEGADLILSDLRLPDGNGIDLLRWMRKEGMTQPFIIMTDYAEVHTAVESMKLGSLDYIPKQLIEDKLVPLLRSIRKEAEKRKASRTTIFKREGKAFLEIARKTRLVAPTRMSVLITGENGTGKEHVAQAIHARGRCSDKPFVAVDCGSLSDTLAASAFLGHVKGAFTGADTDRTGYFREAEGGTLFLDEIGNLSPDTQQMLLRVIQERRYRPVGAKSDVSSNVRIIAATNENLYEAVAEKRFRQDLLYRINTIELHIPPLRERGNDILLLADYFLDCYARKYKKKIGGLTRDAKTKLQSYAWPGNVRELQHAIERAVILSDGPMLRPENFMLHPAPAQKKGEPEELNLGVLEKEAIERALRRADGNITRAAELLGITRFALYRKLDKLGL